MRGYDLSSRPGGIEAYETDKLGANVRGLIHERGAESALLIGHEWGGSTAWVTAMNHPEVVDRLAILNAARGTSSATSFTMPTQTGRTDRRRTAVRGRAADPAHRPQPVSRCPRRRSGHMAAAKAARVLVDTAGRPTYGFRAGRVPGAAGHGG